MAEDRDELRDWHRLFGLLLTDLFTDSPFIVDVERDLSKQQQFLDVVILRRGPGRFIGLLPDGLEELAEHNLITFKSLHEALDAWAMKELVGYYVAYRKLVSSSPSKLLPEDRFRLYAVCARFPHNLSGQVPWQEHQAGVYDCRWGTDVVRIVVAGQLPREPHNAPLHLFSASPPLVDFGGGRYQMRSAETSSLIRLLLERFQEEGSALYTMKDFKRDYFKEYFPLLTPEEKRGVLDSMTPEEKLKALGSLTLWEKLKALGSQTPQEKEAVLGSLTAQEQREVVDSLTPEERLEGLSTEQIREYLDKLTAKPRKPRRKK